MPGYADTKKLIEDTLVNRPAGTVIVPEDHQTFALSMLDYIHAVELLGASSLQGAATVDTVPVQPTGSRVSYISSVPPGQTYVYTNFLDENGHAISVTSGANTVSLLTLLWNGTYWTVSVTPVTLAVGYTNGYLFKGIAVPTDNPGTPDQNVFYIASQTGTYTNFGGLAVADGEVAILRYNGSWAKEITGAATAEKVTRLEAKVDGTVVGRRDYPSFIINKYYDAAAGLLTTANGWVASSIFELLDGCTIKFGENVAGYYMRRIVVYDGGHTYLNTIYPNNAKKWSYPIADIKNSYPTAKYVGIGLSDGTTTTEISESVTSDFVLYQYNADAAVQRVKNEIDEVASNVQEIATEALRQELQIVELDRLVRIEHLGLVINSLWNNTGAIQNSNGWARSQQVLITPGCSFKMNSQNSLGFYLYALQIWNERKEYLGQYFVGSSNKYNLPVSIIHKSYPTAKYVGLDIYKTGSSIALTEEDVADFNLVVDSGDTIEEQLQEINQRLSNNTDIVVSLDTENKSVKITSRLSDAYDIENSMFWKDDESFGYNPCANYGGTSVIRKSDFQRILVNGEGDNVSATSVQYGWMGANHGLYPLSVATITGHGKTFADIGSKWERQADSMIFVLVQVRDENTLAFVPMYSVNPDNNLPYFSGSLSANDVLSHSEGATHTGGFTISSVTSKHWYPSENIVSRNLYVDGKEITRSGEYNGERFDLIETYDVLNPADFLDIIIGNVGQFTDNPLPKQYLDRIGVMVRYANDYRFTSGGTGVLFIDWIVMERIRFNMFFPLDVKPMSTSGFPGGGLQYYLPKGLPLTIGAETYDYRTPVPLTTPSASLDWTPEFWENPLLPPDRAIEFVDDGANRVFGLHHGYVFDQGVASGENRKDHLTRAWWIYTTMASYNGALESSKIGDILNRGQHYGMVCFRKYEDYTNNPSGVISVSQFEVNGRYYIYADFNAEGTYEIHIPAKWQGKEITILEKRSNVSVISSLGVSPILIEVANDAKMYGYAVIEIK